MDSITHLFYGGVIAAADVRATLADLCRNPPPARDAAQRTVFKAVGTALEDLAAAILACGEDRGSAAGSAGEGGTMPA